MIKYFPLFLLLFSDNIVANNDWQASQYFNTQFLMQYDKVKETLVADDFREVTFTSLDGISIKGLYRKKANARINVVLSAGFYPGRKEGMASFIKLLPDDTNILFLDARGHGESSGPFWRTILWYGHHEFKDIIGALDFLCADNDKPNILLGVCIGAFHCTHAALFLEKQEIISAYNLKALIFDSGFGSIADLMWVPSTHIKEKTLPNICISWLYSQDTKTTVKDRLLYKMSASLTSGCIQALTSIASPFLHVHDEKMNLFDKIHRLTIPIFYIHSKNDDYTPFADVEHLAETTQNKTCWWIERSEHASHHLKFKEEYKARLLEFIDNSVHT